MSCWSLSINAPKALPSLWSCRSTASPCIVSKQKPVCNSNVLKRLTRISLNVDDFLGANKSILAAQIGAVLATIEYPALAVTGVNYEPDLKRVVIEVGLIAVWYFLIMPPIIMNWLRIRWYRRKFFEMYLQFMFVFMFFPGCMLWAPFLNFRKFPRDPSLKFPWEKPQDPSKIKNDYLKYPFADPEDYS